MFPLSGTLSCVPLRRRQWRIKAHSTRTIRIRDWVRDTQMHRSRPEHRYIYWFRARTSVLAELSCVRRSAHISRRYPYLKFKDVRGNIRTRLSKLDAEDAEFKCLILAAAGLQRLDLGDRITQFLDSKTPGGGVLHAVGQGALEIEIREGDQRIIDLLRPLADMDATLACLAERSLMRTLEGGCSVPIGVERNGSKKESL
jgi:porphobilinogen deaminase